jgi:hypothetical protein
MKCLELGAGPWCGDDTARDTTDNPRDATCSECLKIAAEYGAAAAMRYAAVEAGVTHDPELERERDAALETVNRINRAITRQGGFFCTSCQIIRPLQDRAVVANDVMWCRTCLPVEPA